MSLVTGNNLAKYYGADVIFSGISFEIPHQARIALVGPNGAGKTTLLNLIIGADIPTEGEIFRARDLKIGFLPQRPELLGEHTIREEALHAFDHLREMEKRLNQLEHDLADPDKHDDAMITYGELQEAFERLGGYTYESEMRIVLRGVGFEEADFDTPLNQLSGGQKTRALLARLLLERPNLLVLDEPTNHLDIQAVEWLEGYLKDFPGAVLAVSHDRYFMDKFASTIWELDWGSLEVYRGNYSHYVRQRTERHERLLKEYERQQEFIEKEMDFIRRNMGSRGTAQAKGRLKRLETMKKRGKIINKPRGERREMNLRIQAAIRSGDKVLETKNLTVGYDTPLFQVPDIVLWRGETAALIGPNGVGKSTFLKTVIGQIPPLSGEAVIGASVKIGYFAQAHEKLDPSNNLIDEITAIKPMPLSEARNYLGAYLFSGDDVFRQVATLSGGERGRLALAKLALDGANLLLLDEPTNHLDIDSQEVLQEVLAQYDGTILLVSHDRYLIDALATQIWAASPGQLQVFNGTYQEFVAARNNSTSTQTDKKSSDNRQSTSNIKPKRHGLNPFQLKKRLTEVEDHIEALENQLAELTDAIATASAAGDAEKVRQLGEIYTQTQADLQTMMAEWEILAE
ncbi:MAG: ABC transporter ATP-binding protein [Phototrophicales bacterium]|nr:MAG: ABC transporter ATP-binding protein [Phototrophicales bacterium]RMG72086.1 MAG: ABC transporter ATP-binding protein [Chloroflexota bacterium]